MQPDAVLRQYAILKPSPRTLLKSADALRDLTVELIMQMGAPRELSADLAVRGDPSHDWTPEIEGWPDLTLPPPAEIVVPYEFSSPAWFDAFRGIVLRNLTQTFAGNGFTDVGADPGGYVTDHYHPGPDGAAFSTRREARRLLGVDRLPADVDEAARARPRVNVVIIDQGLNKDALPKDNWGGGWAYKKGSPTEEILPGTAEPRSHGMTIARNILNIAPSAMLYDFPVIPPERIHSATLFAHQAHVAYEVMRATIALLRQRERWQGPWILVNAWAVANRKSEYPLGDYTEDTHPWGHPLNKAVGRAVADRIDVVFAAGNCGQFCPNANCGAGDRGPGQSIWGANSHPAVLTVGAVLTNEKWIGYSSQGPGQFRLTREKPDLCAPSHFCEPNDASVVNTGTSTACALTAGALAVLRSKWDTNAVSTADMKFHLAAAARRPTGSETNGRVGAGILDVGEAWARLSQIV